MRVTPVADRPRFMVQLLADVPNAVTLVGFYLAFSAILLAVNRRFELAMIAALWAMVADWIDGWLAGLLSRSGRARDTAELGAQLDSFADLTSSGIFPAVVLTMVGGFSGPAIAAALFVASAGVLRLSYFNVFGATENGRTIGLPLPHNILALSAVFLLRPLIGEDQFFPVLAAVNVMLGVLNVSPFFFPRGRVGAIPWIIAIAVIATAGLAWLAVS